MKYDPSTNGILPVYNGENFMYDILTCFCRIYLYACSEETLQRCDEIIRHFANNFLPIDLNDGVKVNYARLQDVLTTL